MKISANVSSMQFSPIRRFNPIAAEAEASGKKVYKLNIGQPDIETPTCFFDAVKHFDEKVLAYEQSSGDARLIDAIRDYNRRDYGVELSADDIIVTMGASEALNMTFATILDAGDEVLIAEPFYSNYSTFIKTVSGRIRPIPTRSEDGYRYADRKTLESALTPECRAIVCINPGNPTGLVLTRKEMETIANFAIEHDLWIISDEAYREYVYDGLTPTSFGCISRVADRLIVIDSVSKRFSACGARIGYAACKNEDFMSGMMKLAQARLCVPTIDQIGAAAMFRLPGSYYDETRAKYQARRDAAYEEIMKIPHVICRKPQGAFYMMIDLPVDDAEDFLMFMLTKFEDHGETVMFAPAPGFYQTPGSGRSEIRIAYVLNPDDMRRGCELLRLGVRAYNAVKRRAAS